MKETRLKKYQNYRKQIEKQFDDTPVETQKPATRVIYASTNTNTNTSALPLDEIIKKNEELSEEELLLKQQQRKQRNKLLLAIGGGILFATAIIVIGILLFL
jgi:hypothetical protein